MSARAGIRYFSQAQTLGRQQFRSQFRQTFQRRAQSTTANPAAEAPKQSFFQRMWTSEVGVKTVHFWAPVMKWCVVLAGASDFFRPPEKLSLTQNLALMATGTIWTRWCFVIRPQNMLLAAVNFCLAIVGVVQVSRILAYNSSVKGSKKEALKEMGDDLVSQAKSVETAAKKELKS